MSDLLLVATAVVAVWEGSAGLYSRPDRHLSTERASLQKLSLIWAATTTTQGSSSAVWDTAGSIAAVKRSRMVKKRSQTMEGKPL